MRKLIEEVKKVGWNTSEAKSTLKRYIDPSKTSNEFFESAMKEEDHD